MAKKNSYNDNSPSGVGIPVTTEYKTYTAADISFKEDNDDPDPAALIDENTVILFNNDVHNDINYVPLQRSNINNKTDYVLVEAFNNNKKISSALLRADDDTVNITKTSINVNVLKIIRDKLSLSNGQYNIRVCLYRNYVYSVNAETEEIEEPGKIRIEEISPTRREIRVQPNLQKYNSSVNNLSNISPKQSDFEYETVWPIILKDVERNINLLSTNWLNIDSQDETNLDQVIFKLVEPLPTNIKVGNTFQVTRDLVSSYIIPVSVKLISTLSDNFEELRGPNFKAVDVKDKPSRSTMFETWDSLVGTNATTQQSIINKYISGSDNTKLNLDYRKYDNFVHFSSATERLKNFKYKLDLVEFYNSQSEFVTTQWVGKTQSGATGSSEFLQNKSMYDSKRNAIISGFDGYEKYLYYESHSLQDTTYGVYPAATWPKHTTTKPYQLIHTTGSEAISWYNNQLISASLYDETNNNMLRNTIPTHILQDVNSDSYVTFIDMIGQHFDTIYNYISNIVSVTDREESLYDGLSKDLIYDTAKSFGWSLQSGFDTSKLWEYALGTDETGSYGTATNTVVSESYSHEDIEKQTWKRIVNNIPYLLKTKGTARGIKALLNTYGIPNTILQIQEYGGPAPSRVTNSRREIEKFSYALDFSGSSCIAISHSQVAEDFTPSSVGTIVPAFYEFRFDTNTTQSMHLASSDTITTVNGGVGGVSKFEVILEHSSSADVTSSYAKYGRLVFKLTSGSYAYTSMSTDYAPFYDNDWWNVSFGTKTPVTSSLNRGQGDSSTTSWEIKYSKVGEHSDDITFTGSVTFEAPGTVPSNPRFNSTWAPYGTAANERILFGGTGSGESNATYLGFSGSMQEIRQWGVYITDNAFNKHTLAPTSIAGDTISMAYDNLISRHRLGTDSKKYNHSTGNTTILSSSAPNSNTFTPFTVAGKTTLAEFISWPDKINYSNKSETYYVDTPNSVGARPHDNKIRIEPNRLSGSNLAHDKTFEISLFDTNALDTNEISVAFSPQDQIDIDIAMQFGGFSLDDYIGDPRDSFSKEYASLKTIRDLYFKKFDDKYNIWAFIRLLNFFNKGLFRQIESLLPARADATVGLIIRPNVLERVKLDTSGFLSRETLNYTSSIKINTALTGTAASQSFENSLYLINTATINTGVRASNPGRNRYRDGSEYTYGNYTSIGVQPFVSGSSDAQRNLGQFSGSTSSSIPQYVYSKGLENLIVLGSRLTSPDFNENCPETIDGAPAVEFILTNPNQLAVTERKTISSRSGRNNRRGPSRGGSISEITVR